MTQDLFTFADRGDFSKAQVGDTPKSQHTPPGKYTVVPQKKCAAKTDRNLFDLAPGWALGCDRHQWTLLRARQRHAEVVWQPVAYVGSTKSVLRRCVREKGVQPTSDALVSLDALPEHFLDWRGVTK